MANVTTGLQSSTGSCVSTGAPAGVASFSYQSHQLAPVSSIEYRVVFALVFSVCLCLVVLNRVLPRALRFLDSTGSRCSLLCEAKNAAQSTVPYIFQV